MNRSFSKNKGYSLIEMIITIAIIAILATIATVSVTIIHSARAKDSALKLDAQVAQLITKNKNMTVEMDDLSDPLHPKKINCNNGLMIYHEDERYKISEVYVKPDGKYLTDASNDPILGETITLPKTVEVEFEGTYISFLNAVSFDRSGGYHPATIGGTGPVCIVFDRRGECKSGYGTYSFKKNNGNVVSKVTIRKNGSHEVR